MRTQLKNIINKVKGKATKDISEIDEADIGKLIANARKIYNMDSMGLGYWGNSIKFSSPPENVKGGDILRVVGWKPSRPRKDDLLRMRLASNKVAIAIFLKVDLCNDPNDMFFGNVKLLGYDLNYGNLEFQQ